MHTQKAKTECQAGTIQDSVTKTVAMALRADTKQDEKLLIKNIYTEYITETVTETIEYIQLNSYL